MNFYNTLLKILIVNYGEFLQHTLSNFEVTCGDILQYTLSNFDGVLQ